MERHERGWPIDDGDVDDGEEKRVPPFLVTGPIDEAERVRLMDYLRTHRMIVLPAGVGIERSQAPL